MQALFSRQQKHKSTPPFQAFLPASGLHDPAVQDDRCLACRQDLAPLQGSKAPPPSWAYGLRVYGCLQATIGFEQSCLGDKPDFTSAVQSAQ